MNLGPCPEPNCPHGVVEVLEGVCFETRGLDLGAGPTPEGTQLDSVVACNRCEFAMTFRELLAAGQEAA